MARFDDRRLKSVDSDDGTDFRTFVGEHLRIVPGYGQPVALDSGGVDGCIDLYCEDEGLVVECKFIAADVVSPSDRVDQEWEGIRKKLSKALAYEHGVAKPTRNPFRPWADADRPINRYVFATSAQVANLQRRRDLEETIRKFFHEDIAARPGYSHLSTIEVEVLDWVLIEQVIQDLHPLRFRWLDSWPPGFAELATTSPRGFRAFLYGDKLPYLSRDTWQAAISRQVRVAETELLERLTEPDTDEPALVIIGPGGVGKTRLAIELAHRLREAGWWTLQCDGSRATIDGLRTLVGSAPKQARIVLLVDYLELWPGFDAVAAEVAELSARTTHQIRLIATCRSSYGDRLPLGGVRIVSIGDEQADEAAYGQAVTAHILSRIGADTPALIKACRHNFALAAFLYYLKQEKPDDFEAEIGALSAEQDFATWTLGRLRRAGLISLAPVAALLAASPLPVMEFDRLARAHDGDAAVLMRVLAGDRWLERQAAGASEDSGPCWATFHDVFTDLLLSHVLGNAPDLSDLVDRLLFAAAQSQVLRHTLGSLERIRQAESLNGLDWGERLSELERRMPGVLARHATTVMNNAIIDPESRLALLERFATFLTAVAANPACDASVGHTMLGLVRKDTVNPERLEATLTPLIDASIERSPHYNLPLRLAFHAHPDNYRVQLKSRIVSHPTALQTQFLLNAGLSDAVRRSKSGASDLSSDILDFESPLLTWLKQWGTKPVASFVLKPWLSAAATIKGERAAEMVRQVETSVMAWLATGDQARRLDAQFIYTGWLDAAASIRGERANEMVRQVESAVMTWLATGDRAYHPDSSFIYAAWLNAAAAVKGEHADEMVRQVESAVMDWLATEDQASRLDAQFIYTGWLDAAASIRGERANEMVRQVESAVMTWLATGDRAYHPDSSFIYAAWLNAAAAVKGEHADEMIRQIESAVMDWLATGDQASRLAAQFIYAAWLNAAAAIKGEHADEMVRQVESAVMTWLATGDQANHPGTKFIYAAWLNTAAVVKGSRAGELVQKIQPAVLQWLAIGENATSPETTFIYRGLLDAAAASRSPFVDELIKPFEPLMVEWLSLQWSMVDATFLLKHFIRRRGLPESVVFAAIDWCSIHPGHVDAAVRFSSALRAGNVIETRTKDVLRVAMLILRQQNYNDVLAHPFEKASCRFILAELARMGTKAPRAATVARYYLARWLRDPRWNWAGRNLPSKHPTFDQRTELIECVITLLEQGEFRPVDSKADHAIIADFCEWVGTWVFRRRIRTLCDNLVARFGLPDLWGRMTRTDDPVDQPQPTTLE